MTSSLRSREITPKRELRPGKPCEGCLAEAAEPRRRTLVLLIASVCVALVASVRVSAQDVGTEAQRESGKKLYLKNCSQCHGDNMSANGMFAHGLDPIPTNFHDTIPQLRETFLLWRISKGGPGLPDEGGPWDTAMPAWEKFLKEDEMWDAILFLYDFTELKPRAREEATAK